LLETGIKTLSPRVLVGMTDYGYYIYEEFLECLERAHDLSEKTTYTTPDLLRLALEATDILGANWYCFSCGGDCFEMGEDFYVQDKIWTTYGVEGVLCIGCLEARMGRHLTPQDFLYSDQEKVSEEKVKSIREWRARIGYTPSERLLDRCGGDYAGNDGYR
jgi:hypothetical protein